MNPRYLPGGEKFESIRDDERRSFYELVQADQQDILESIRCRVRSWTNNEIENRDEPTYFNFIAEYPEYRAEAWESLIEEEMDRTVKSIASDERGRLSGLSKAGLIIRSTFDLR